MDLQAILDQTDDSSSSSSFYKKGFSSGSDVDLEEILREDDDDDEDDDSLPQRPLYPYSNSFDTDDTSPSHNPQEWALLQSILQDDEEDDDHNKNEFLLHEMLTSPDTTTNDSDDDSFPSSLPPQLLTHNYRARGSSSVQESPRNQTNDKAAPVSQPTPPPTSTSQTKSFENESRRNLQQALIQERQLLLEGRREIVSPLMVKRRLRHSVALEESHEKVPTGAGMLQVQDMDGPRKKEGLPTCLACNSKFITIGTQQGSILVLDLFAALRHLLKIPQHQHAVTCMDLTNEWLLAGYTSSTLVLWDVLKGTILKTLEATHFSPITGVRFLSPTRAVTCDAGGLVHLLSFKSTIWNISVETDCLLDGSAGQILAMDIVHHQNMTLTALSSERSSFVVALEPTVHVLYRWGRPNENEADMPCLAWNGNILARAWGQSLEFLEASFPNTEPEEEKAGPSWPAFGMDYSVNIGSRIVALSWLAEHSLLYLTEFHEFYLVDTLQRTVVERLDFSHSNLVYAEFALSRTSTSCVTFGNSIRTNHDRLLVLCQESLKVISILDPQSRVKALEDDGEWLEALALALDHYEGTKKSRSIVTLPENEDWIAKLLLRYIHLAVDNAPDHVDLVTSHYQMLAGVCVEFCVVTQRLDLLYGPIFQTFSSVGFSHVLLDVLEPYVLTDQIKYIAPSVMSILVEKCKAADDIATVERCLLHLDCTMMDFDSILSLLRTNEMYTALFFVFTKGLDDFITPLEILLERVLDEADTGMAGQANGYKAILYLQMSFQGKLFPIQEIPEDRRPSVCRELLLFLVQERYAPSPLASRKHRKDDVQIGARASRFPYLSVFLQVDAQAMLDTLAIAFESPHFIQDMLESSLVDDTPASKMVKRQDVVNALLEVLLPGSSSQTLNLFLDFAAKYLMSGAITVPNDVVFMVLTRACQVYAEASGPEDRLQRQRNVLDLLGALPGEAYDPDKVLALIQKFSIHRAALLLHQQVASAWYGSTTNQTLRYDHFKSAIDCYLGDEDTEFRKDVFQYVRKECAGSSATLHHDHKNFPTRTLRDGLRKKLPDLIRLDAGMAVRLVAELFVDFLDEIVDELANDGLVQFLLLQAIISGNRADADPAIASLPVTMKHHHTYLELMVTHHPTLVYEYLSTHDNYRAAEALELCQAHDIADASAYLLEKMGNVSSALQLILQRLESKLMSLKRSLRSMGMESYDKSRSYLSRSATATATTSRPPVQSKQGQEIENVKRILIVALDVCSRNSGSTTRPEQGSQLWFNVLDRLIHAKTFLRLDQEPRPHHALNILSDLLRMTMQRMVSNVALEDLVRKVTTDHSGSKLGELRAMWNALLGTYDLECQVVVGAHRALRDDLQGLRRLRHGLEQEGSLVSDVPHLSPGSGTKEAIVQVHNPHVTTFVDSIHNHSQQAAHGLGAALNRLERRRKIPKREKAVEMNSRRRAIDPVGPYVVGELGEAEHFGRLQVQN